MSKNAVKALAEIARFSRGAVEVWHLATVDCEGQLDDEWIPKQASEGYLLITTDRGKKKSRGGKLPVLCERNGMRYVMMSAAVHGLNQFDKLRAIFAVWPKLIEASTASPGSGFVLKKKQNDGFEVVLSPPIRQKGPPVQRSLLEDDGPRRPSGAPQDSPPAG